MSSSKILLTIDSHNAKMRIDKALFMNSENISRSKITQFIKDGYLTRDGEVVTQAKTKTQLGETYLLKVPKPKPFELKKENIPLDILYEDTHLIVVNKQAGLTVHPGAGQPSGTLVNGLLYHCSKGLSQIGDMERPGIVHRLDSQTSGVMVIAKSDSVHMHLASQFANRTIERAYYTFIWRNLVPQIGEISANIGRHPRHRTKMAIVKEPEGRYALTYYKCLENYGDFGASMVECKLATGRTHQIRVHMASRKTPIIGDQTYGIKNPLKAAINDDAFHFAKFFPRQALHAWKLGFIHPILEDYLLFETKMPEDMEKLHHLLQKSRI